MAEPSEGVYIVRCLGAGNRCMDVTQGSDKKGANVRVWNQNGGDVQMWCFDKQSGGWQILCSLTGKCLDIEAGKVAAGTNVRQWSDNNTNSQRWALNIVTTTNNHSVITIKPTGNNNLSLAAASNSNGANIKLAASNDSSTLQRWELVPVNVLTTGGTYEIVLASDPKMCIDIASGSTANKANVQVYTRNGSTAQVFRAAVDDQSDRVVFYNGKSNKVLEAAKGESSTSGTTVQQYTYNGTDAQKWLVVKSGNVKINGQTVPTYEIKATVGSGLCMDCKNGSSKAKTDIRLYTDNNSLAQRFAFVKTDLTASDISVPGAIQQTLHLTDTKKKVLSGLQFASKQTMFQARYQVRYYSKGRKSYTTTKWMNYKDNSAANEGWGAAWTYTFKATPNAGYVTIPISKTITIPNNRIAADVYIQVRTFTDTYKSGFKAHGTAKQTIVKIRQNPKVTWGGTSLVVGDNQIGLKLTFKESVGEGCTRFRARLLNSQGLPISKYVNSTTMSLTFNLGNTLQYLPTETQSIKAEWTMLFKDGITKSGYSGLHTFSRGTQRAWPTVSNKPDIKATYDGSGSYTLILDAPKYHRVNNTNVNDWPNVCLVMTVPTVDGNETVVCPKLEEKTVSGQKRIRWRCAPPLNTNTKIEIYGAKANSKIYYYGTKTVNIKSHSSIWNWGSTKTPYDSFVNLILNSDNPPQQTRNFETNISFHDTTGRTWPVAFASRSLKGDLSVSGVVLDPGLSPNRYQLASPMPPHSSLASIKALIPLSGKGVHPLYRTPYGDWYHVGIESVQFDKTQMYLTNVSVTQHALED